MTTNPKVDMVLGKAKAWQAEFHALRAIVVDCGLSEVLKWGQPCYMLENQNIVLIHGFKAYCALLFFKGALMQDPAGILIQQTKNVQAARQIRFTGVEDIARMENLVKSYIQDAIAVEKTGATVSFKSTDAFEMPEEFRRRLEELPDLKAAFEALTPGRQRAYLLHFSGAKQASTRQARIAKHLPRILEGKGLDD